MNTANPGFTWALVVATALSGIACGPAVSSSPTPPDIPAAAATPAPAGVGPPSSSDASLRSLTIGLAGHGIGALPIYVAIERTFPEEGLNVELLTSGSGSAIAQALAAGSVDVSVSGLSTLINMIDAGLRAKAFYAGFNQADFAWFGGPEVRSWTDLKGKSVAVSSYGDITAFLTRQVLRKHGLEPERDVDLRTTGGSANSLAALGARQVDSAILAPPMSFKAEADGFAKLGAQATELAEQWPKIVFVAREQLLDAQPDTIRALLRAHVKAIRLAKADREATIDTIMRVLNYERHYAELAYDEAIGGYDERGLLPTAAMPVFWEVAISGGELKERWEESRFLDRRFIDSFDQWAPK
jgi:NitT/TauT family transport system substrate-binding protein